MDRMKCQELALVRMVKMGELVMKKDIFGKTIWHSMPEKKKVRVRDKMPQMELQQGLD